MGLFDSISSAFTSVKNTLINTITDIKSSFSSQLSAFPGVPQGTGGTFSTNIGTGGGIVGLASGIANTAKAAATIGGTALVATAAGGYIAKNPLQAASNIPKTFSAVADLGGTFSQIQSGNFSSGLGYIQEHPVASGVIGAAGLLAIGKGTLSAVNAFETYQNTKAIDKSNNLMSSLSNITEAANYTGLAGEPTNKQDVKIADITGDNALNLARENNKAAMDLEKLKSDTAIKLASLQSSPSSALAPTANSAASAPKTKKKKKKVKVKPKSKKKPSKKKKRKASSKKKKSKKRKK